MNLLIMTLHHLNREQTVNELNTDPTNGLQESEVAARIEKYGENKLREKKKKTNLSRFFDQFKDVMILILIAAAAISFGSCVAMGSVH